MDKIKPALVPAVLLWLSFLVSVTRGYAATSDVLYVQDGHNLVTYAVNYKSVTKLGALYINASPDYPIQIFHAPSAPFLYILGFTSANEEYFWAHATTPQGVPTENPIQKFAVKPSLTQFLFHPNGNFAYALYSWTDQNGEYVGDVVLYKVDPQTGMLTNTHQPVANFPPNFFWQTFLYGMNSTGTKLYTRAYVNFRDSNGNDFYYYTIDPKTGLLGPQVYFWQDDAGTLGAVSSDISNQFIALDFNYYDGPVGINLFTNKVYPTDTTPTPLIACDATMLAVCGDSSSTQFSPAGKYLFVNDYTIQSVVVLDIDLNDKLLKETGSSIPGNPSILSFSPDGEFVYAVEDKNVLVYDFNRASGLLTAQRTINFPLTVGGIAATSHP